MDDSPWADEDLSDDEFPEWDDDDSDETACPECGAVIYDDSVQCPRCGAYITFDTNRFSDKPLWWMALGLLGVIALVVVLLLR